MDLLACLLMAVVLWGVAYIAAAIVIAVAMIISGARWCRFVEVLRITADAFGFVPGHIVFSSVTIFYSLLSLAVTIGYAVGIVSCLAAGFVGFLFAAFLLLFLWYMVMGTKEKRVSHKHDLVTLRNRWKKIVDFGGRSYSRFCAQLLSVVIGCVVAWWSYVSVWTPFRLHMVKGVLEKRFDERLSGTKRSAIGWKTRRLCRHVMRETMTDDWRLQLVCGDIPIDWLLDGVGDLNRRVFTFCPVETTVCPVETTEIRRRVK